MTISSGHRVDQNRWARDAELCFSVAPIPRRSAYTSTAGASCRLDRSRYVRLVIDEMIPRAAADGLADACDGHLERAAFSLEEARAILSAARRAGLHTKLHAGQFTDLGGGELVAELGALSADHHTARVIAGGRVAWPAEPSAVSR